MRRFAALLDRLGYEPGRNAKLRLLADYFGSVPDPDRGWALAALTDGLPFSFPLRKTLTEMMARKMDPELFRLSRDYVGDTAETIALVWESESSLSPFSRGEGSSLGGERMLDLVALRNHLRSLGLAGHRAGERLLGGAIIVILDLLVVGRIPMDEDPDADEEIVRLGFRDDAFGDAVGDRLGYRVLRRPEHLHRLLGALDGHLVEQNRRGLGEQVRSNHREQRGEAFLVVRQRMRERGFGCASARSDQEIDVGDLVAVADERFTDAEFRDLRHLPTLLPRKSDASPTGHVSVDRHMATLVVSVRQEMPDRLAG
jgi:hypothetical protein